MAYFLPDSDDDEFSHVETSSDNHDEFSHIETYVVNHYETINKLEFDRSTDSGFPKILVNSDDNLEDLIGGHNHICIGKLRIVFSGSPFGNGVGMITGDRSSNWNVREIVEKIREYCQEIYWDWCRYWELRAIGSAVDDDGEPLDANPPYDIQLDLDWLIIQSIEYKTDGWWWVNLQSFRPEKV